MKSIYRKSIQLKNMSIIANSCRIDWLINCINVTLIFLSFCRYDSFYSQVYKWIRVKTLI